MKTTLEKVWEHLQALLRLLKSWARGGYRQIPWLSISLAAAAVLYFVNPFDLIPDYIPVIGYLDDGTVISIAVAAMGEDFKKFLAWEQDGANNEGGCHVG